jgi:hypothetical protein
MGKRYMTAVAQEAMDIGDHLLLLFSKKTVGENPQMRVDVAKPDGPSTEGGKKARQTISLVPVEGVVSGKVMVGWLDVAQKRVEVRSFRVVRYQYYERYGTDFKVAQSEYEEVVEELSNFLQARGFSVAVKDEMPAGRLSATQHQGVPAPIGASNNDGVPWIWIAVSLVIGAGGIALGAMLF